MQSLDLRNQLIYLINNSDDTSLRSIFDFAQFVQKRKLEESNSLSDKVFSLTDDQKKELDTIREKHLSGKTSSLSLEELRQKFTKQYGISLES